MIKIQLDEEHSQYLGFQIFIAITWIIDLFNIDISRLVCNALLSPQYLEKISNSVNIQLILSYNQSSADGKLSLTYDIDLLHTRFQYMYIS